jgi:RNA polymerase sigma factor, sigma-70 family
MGLHIFRTKETEWVERCKKQDRQAQKELFDAYSRKMLSLCCRYIKDRAEAEDIMITSLAKVFGKIDQYKGEGSFEGWMRRIVVNEALSHLRRNKNMYLETDLEMADRQPDFQQLENTLEAEDLLKLIAALPSGYRVVFNMYAIDGYSHKEIAEQLGINENTSKSQLSRARAYLQRNLVEIEGQKNQNIIQYGERN